jgi:hypothetical protein
VFQKIAIEQNELWTFREQSGLFHRGRGEPVWLNTGPLYMSRPSTARSQPRMYVSAAVRQAELQIYDAKLRSFVPFLRGVAAEHIKVSRDGKWISYVTYPNGVLWRARVDGSQALRLSPPGVTVATGGFWSPDGTRLAYCTRTPGRGLYLVSAESGTPEKLPVDGQYALIASWSPDGKSLALGPWLDSANLRLRIFNLETRTLSDLPGSEGMVYALWSPDGNYIAGELFPQNGKPMLYDTRTKKWRELPFRTFNYWDWSRDSQYLYFDTTTTEHSEVMRCRVKDGKVEKFASLQGVHRVSGMFGPWFGLGPGDSPLVMRRGGLQQIYAIDWDAP